MVQTPLWLRKCPRLFGLVFPFEASVPELSGSLPPDEVMD